MMRRVGFCAAAAARQRGAVRGAVPAALVDGMAAAERGFKLSSLGASFLADRVAAPAGAPAIRPPPFPLCFVDVTYPTGRRSSFIVRPERRRFFSTNPKPPVPELPCPGPDGAKAAPFVGRDDGVVESKQHVCAGDVAGAKEEAFEGLEGHRGQEHPDGGVQIDVKAAANGDQHRVKGNLDFDVSMGDEVAPAKPDAFKGLEGQGGKKNLAGDQIGAKVVEAVGNDDEDHGGGKEHPDDDHIAFKLKALHMKDKLVAPELLSTEEAAEEDGMPDVHVVALYSDPRIKGCLLKNVEVDFVAGAMADLLDVVDGDKEYAGTGEDAKGEQGPGTGNENSSQDRTGDEQDSRENPSQDYSDDHLCVAPAARRRFRRTSKLDMSLAAHFAGHRVFVTTVVDKASAMVMYNTRLHMQLMSKEIKLYMRNTRAWKAVATFFGVVFAGMLVFYLGVNYMLEEVEALYESLASSDFTKEKVREMAQHAVGEISPSRLLKKGLRWPWSGGKEEVKVVLPPRKPKRSFQEWLSSVFVSFVDWVMSIFRGGEK